MWNITQRQLGGCTGDEEADAAIDASTTIWNIKQAEGLMDQARRDWDSYNTIEAADNMDEAIKKRPGDWTYRVSRSALDIEYQMGDPEKAQKHQDEAY